MKAVFNKHQDDTTITTVIGESIIGREADKNEAEEKMLSIYDIYSKFKRSVILCIMSSLGFLSIFDELVYTPALPAMIKDFHTTETLGFLTVGSYLFGMGLSSLIWGVLSDYYGRKTVTIYALICLILSSIGCYLSPNIYIFIICRALQGCLVAVTAVIGQGTIADIYSPNNRGTAYGIFYGFFSFGGFCGPTLGGQISRHYGWRSIFILVTILTFVLFICYVLIVPETLQYKVMCTYKNQRKITLMESNQISEPKLMNPCLPLLHIRDSTIIPYAFVAVCNFSAINCGTVLFSTEMAEAPYFFHEDIVGLLFIPISIAYLLGSIVGGKLSDLFVNRYYHLSKILEISMIPGLIFSILTIVGLAIYGWSRQYGLHFSIPTLGQILFIFGQAVTRPGIMSYLTIKYQDQAASISAAINFLQTLLTSIILPLAPRVVQAIKDGPFFTILAAANLLTTIVAAFIISRKLRLSKNSETKSLL